MRWSPVHGPPLLPMFAVEAPADVSVIDDFGDDPGGVEIEAEALLHHGSGDQFPDPVGFEPGIGQVEHGARRTGPAGSSRPAIGRPCPGQIGQVVAVGGDGGFEQRREGRQIRSHDGDVPRLERRIVLEGVEDGITGDFDLATGTVSDVDLHRVVGGGHGGRTVGLDVGLELGKQTDALTGVASLATSPKGRNFTARRARRGGGDPGGVENKLQLAEEFLLPNEASNGCAGAAAVGSSPWAVTLSSLCASVCHSPGDGCNT